MDFDRLAREFLMLDLSAVAHFFMLASAVPLVISMVLYCTRDRWLPALGRLVSVVLRAKLTVLGGSFEASQIVSSG
jgi:hypothetical protein